MASAVKAALSPCSIERTNGQIARLTIPLSRAAIGRNSLSSRRGGAERNKFGIELNELAILKLSSLPGFWT
ncbi:hypothetical protein KQ310_10420 [Synechococcus sp. CS-1328]|nr:hypothetical protein [Synechococcus sp. CS-1328]